MTQELRGLPAPPVPSSAGLVPAAPAERLLRCTGSRRQSADVTTFELEPVAGEGFGWLPGQYLTLNLDLPSGPLSRCYSISSIPVDGLEITVKALPGGPVSGWLHRTLVPGEVLRAHGPLGQFTPASPRAPSPGHNPRYLFLAAGVGITPLMSIARDLLHAGAPADAVLVYSVHGPADVIFHRELRAVPASSGIRVELVLSRGAIPAVGVPRPAGRLDAALLRELVPDLAGREVFACGPPGYLKAVRGMLEQASGNPLLLREESFDIRDQAPGHLGASRTEPARETGDRQAFSVEFARSGRTIECPVDTSVLDAALAAGIHVPSSCTVGMCGTCKSGLLAGAVEMDHAGGIRPREIAAGKILLCCSKPIGNLVIDA